MQGSTKLIIILFLLSNSILILKYGLTAFSTFIVFLNFILVFVVLFRFFKESQDMIEDDE
jgi:hypothetical protein